MKVTEFILNKILTDKDFSGRLSMRMGIKQNSLEQLAGRNSTKLTLYAAILFYKECGFTDEQIFEPLTYQSLSNN
jgi:hypothetical protein